MFDQKFDSLFTFMEVFKDDETCLKYLEKIRWDGEPECPHCGSEHHYKYSDNKTYKCKACGRKYTVRTNTIYYNSNVPLRKWFIAQYLLLNHKNGISSVQLAKDIGVSQPTAWTMLHRIRMGIKPTTPVKMDGVVEVDETYVGGKNKNRHYSKRKKGTQGRSLVDKAAVFGLVERGGLVRSVVVPDVQIRTLSKEIFKTVRRRSSIMSDEWKAYRKLYKHFFHGKVDHGKYEYVNGDKHTNTIEGYWSQLKRSIRGAHIWVSKKHLQKYCYASDFRYNTRNHTPSHRFFTAVNLGLNKYFPVQELSVQC